MRQASALMAEEAWMVLLHNHSELLEEVATLLNCEWPRSLSARMQSISGSCHDLPCSLLLVKGSEGGRKVVGHARLLRVAGQPNAALVESVVVDHALRGRGLGRKLMSSCEEHAKSLGCASLHLSTHDQHLFYQRLGYNEGPSVTPLRNCTSKLLAVQELPQFLQEQPHSSSKTGNTNVSCSDTGSVTLESITVPLPTPPPPPPPPSIPLSSKQLSASSMNTVWYVKSL